MKIEIEEVKISGQDATLILKVRNFVDKMSEYEVSKYLSDAIGYKLVDIYIQEHGTSILSQIAEKPLINMILLRAAGKLSGER